MASRPFLHLAINPDEFVSASGENHYKTSFLKQQITNHLDNLASSPNKVQVSLTTNPEGKSVFAIQAYNGNSPIGDILVGLFPCPNRCVPPEKEFLTFHKVFDLLHIYQAMNYIDCAFLTIQVAKAFIGATYEDSCAIYGVTYDANGSFDPKNENGDKVFISISNT